MKLTNQEPSDCQTESAREFRSTHRQVLPSKETIEMSLCLQLPSSRELLVQDSTHSSELPKTAVCSSREK